MKFSLKPVERETYKPTRACIYVMTCPNYFKDKRELFDRIQSGDWDVYVGVSENEIRKRWKDHKARRARDNQLTTHFIHDNGYEFEDCVRILGEGTINQCKRLEYALRPTPNMGMNKQIGGGQKKYRVVDRKLVELVDAYTEFMHT